ncbi:MAG TPA: FAD-binding protein, partial [Thermodesulfobacteriota bacterium]|nr:FAD-binding protein [Thermodesulfobacteriota bacterium]
MKNTWSEIHRYFETNFRGDVLVDEPLAPHTWYRIGGPADFFAYPADVEDLGMLLDTAAAADCPVAIIGDGANMLVHDNGYRGIVLSLTRYFTVITRNELMVEAQAGVLLPDLVLFCEINNLGGLEHLSGIPGSVGGALIMNAGTRAAEFGDVVHDVTVLESGNRLVEIPAATINFTYRSTPELQ